MHVRSPQLRSSLWIAALLLGSAIVVRFFALGKKCFWLDEVFSLDVCQGLRYDDSTPMLFYSLNRFFLGLPFTPEINGRFGAVILGILTVVVLFLLARDLLPERYRYWVLFLAAFNPLLIQLSQEMRAYGMVTLLSALFFWAGINLVRSASENSDFRLKDFAPWALLMIVSASLGLYTHYVMLTLLVSFFVVCLLLWKQLKRKGLLSIGLSYLMIILLFLPHLSSFRQRLGFHSLQGQQGVVKINSIKILLKAPWGFNLGEIFDLSWLLHPAPNLKGVLLVFLFLGASVLAWWFFKGFLILLKTPSYVRLVPLTFLVLGVFYLITEMSSYRQMAPILPLFLLISAAGMYSLKPGKRVVAGGVALLVYGVALGWFYSLPYQPMNRVDWRAVGAYLEKNVQPGDCVFAACSDLALLALDYYYPGEIIPVDQEAKLYHSSPQRVKRTGIDSETFNRKLAERLRELFETSGRIYVVVEGFTDRVTPQATSRRPVTTIPFSEWLTLKVYTPSESDLIQPENYSRNLQ